MNCIATRTPYRQTGYFNRIVADYIDQHASLKDFFSYPVSVGGIKKAIEDRKDFYYNRAVLVKELQLQYASINIAEKTKRNIELLAKENTFTITTAHQNNIFTGPLYFIYKILHTIKLAEHCKAQLPEYNFVPVFYIGSEDADLEELNHIHLGGEKLVWNTKQTGAVGRMKIDKELLKLIDAMEGQLSVLSHGKEIISLLREFYKEGDSIQSATLGIVNALFGEYGLVVLLPDNAAFKKQMIPVFKDDLLHQTASGIVEKTAAKLDEAGYKVQANPREINLFYLKDDLRNRIEFKNSRFTVHDTKISFTEGEILKELEEYPERFSPNVILRGLYQETILPNIAFIGGGGETAYWLQLKDLFANYKVPFPMLVLRNSFLIVEKKWQDKIAKLDFVIDDFFQNADNILNKFVNREKGKAIQLNGTVKELGQLYENLKSQAGAVDSSLAKHVAALKEKTIYRLLELEKKMLRAEKRKFSDQQRQINAIKENLFPKNGLQERIENISYYYAKWGREFIGELYKHSPALEQEFVVLHEA